MKETTKKEESQKKTKMKTKAKFFQISYNLLDEVNKWPKSSTSVATY